MLRMLFWNIPGDLLIFVGDQRLVEDVPYRLDGLVVIWTLLTFLAATVQTPLQETMQTRLGIQHLFVYFSYTNIWIAQLLATPRRNCVQARRLVQVANALLVDHVIQACLHVALVQHLLLLCLELLQERKLLRRRAVASQVRVLSRVPMTLLLHILRRTREIQRHVTIIHNAALRTAPKVHISVARQLGCVINPRVTRNRCVAAQLLALRAREGLELVIEAPGRALESSRDVLFNFLFRDFVIASAGTLTSPIQLVDCS